MKDIKEILKSKPHIKEVYFNEKEQWLFYPRPSFPIKMTREEVLGEEVEKSKEEKVDTKKKNDKK